jgi:WD40 repeat protein
MMTGKEVRQYRGHAKPIDCVAYSPDGKYVAAGGRDQTIRLWDVATAQQVRCFEGHSDKAQGRSIVPVEQVIFTPDAKALLSRGGDETIRLWDVATGKEVHRFEGHKDPVWTIKLAADGKTVAAYCKKSVHSGENKPGEVRVWEVATGKALRSWLLPDDLGLQVFSPDLKYLATCLRSGGPYEIKLWDVQTGKVARTIPMHPYRVTFSPDSKVLLVKDRDLIRSWDVNTAKELRRVPNPYPNFFTRDIVCPDGKTLLCWKGNAIHFVDIDTGKALRHFEAHDGQVHAIAFSPDGRLVATAEGEGIRFWDPSTQQQVTRIPKHPSFVTTLAFAADGKKLCSGSANHTAHVWDVATGREILKPIKFVGSTSAISPDFTMLAICERQGIGMGESLRLWDMAKRRQHLQLAEGAVAAPPWYAVFSPDSKVLAAGRGRSLRFWEVATGKEFLPHADFPANIQVVAFSPIGNLVGAATWPNRVHLVETSTRKERLAVELAGIPSSVAFSPDGRFLAVAYQGLAPPKTKDGRPAPPRERRWIYLVDLAKGKVVHEFGTHRNAVTCLAFSPDGKRLASGSYDTTTLLWDMERVPSLKLTPVRVEELPARWTDLTGDDAAKAHRTIWSLAHSPAVSVPFLAEKIGPVLPAEPATLARLLADLRSVRIADRLKATRELENFGASAKPALRKVLADDPVLEIRRRIELLLARPDATWSVRTSRALEVLEHAGTDAARRLLRRVADGVPDAVLTQEAQAALRRLEMRPPVP